MRTLLRLSAALVAVALAAGSAAAQVEVQPPQPPPPPLPGPPIGIGIPGGGPQLMLLNHKDVQDELKLSDEQVKKVKELVAQQQEMLKGGAITPELLKKLQEMGQAAQKAIADALKPEQLKRLQQLEVQQRGPMAFFDPRVAKELGITPEQQGKLGMAIAESFKKRAEMFKDLKGDIKELQKRIAEMNRATLDEVVKGLTPEQQTKWKDLAGEPFKGTLPGGIGGFGPGFPPPPPLPEIRPPRLPGREPPGILPPPPPITPPEIFRDGR